MSHARSGALIAIIVFGAFAAYAFLASATYRTSALVVVDAATLPEPIEAARRLSEAILDRKMLEKLSRERAESAAPDAQAQASSSVRRGLEVDTSDARTISISYRDTDAARAQSACNQLAKHAVELAPLVLVDRSAERAIDLKRQEQTQLLAEFLAQHPQVVTQAIPAGGPSLDRDRAFSALTAEKSNLEKRILGLERGVFSDNPYLDPRESDVKLLHRRLAEINVALSVRRQALDSKQTGPQLPPEVLAEWKHLLDAVTQSASDAQTEVRPTLLARLASSAALPSSPIEPDRRLLLFFGLIFGVGLGAAFALAMRTPQERRSKSTRPPVPMQSSPPVISPAAALSPQTGATMFFPAAPALPSGLDPTVRALPSSNRAPPIVPVPQRPISTSPPGVTGGPTADTQERSFLTPPAARQAGASSRPPARRFASTLVLPPAENPTLAVDEAVPDPVLASAEEAWEEQIRAHEVPGFAVVQPMSEPPTVLPAVALPLKPPSSAPPQGATVQRAARPQNPMKVTQPLGSFIPDALWAETVKDAIRAPTPTPRTPGPFRSVSPGPGSQYSYVNSPTATSSSSSLPPPSSKKHVVRVQEVPRSWRPDSDLTPNAQRSLCEKLVPYAVESCFVLTVISVPEAVRYKSRVTAEVALALAESEHPRILLLEGDLHRPWVTRMIGVDMPLSTGFSQQLNARSMDAGEARWTVLGCSRSLHVLAEGMMRSPGLLLSRQFAECLKELRTYYDFIVIDGPTASLDVDSGAIDAVSDGLLTVCPAAGSPALERLQSRFGKKRFSAFATAP